MWAHKVTATINGKSLYLGENRDFKHGCGASSQHGHTTCSYCQSYIYSCDKCMEIVFPEKPGLYNDILFNGGLIYNVNTKEIIYDAAQKSGVRNLFKVFDKYVWGNGDVIWPDFKQTKLQDFHYTRVVYTCEDKIIIYNGDCSRIYTKDLVLIHKIEGELLCMCNKDIWPVMKHPTKGGHNTILGEQGYYCPKNKEIFHKTATEQLLFYKWTKNMEAIESITCHSDRSKSKIQFLRFYKVKEIESPEKVENECRICLKDSDIRAALIPCGHSFFCGKCALDVMNTLEKCPICEKKPSGILRLY